jgi:ferritin-like metal-binding protein YciE
MARTGSETLVQWLNDAHAMEHNLIQVLEHRVQDARIDLDLQTRIQQHLEQTRRHAELVQGCVERLGGKTSSLKAGVADIMGAIQGRSTEPAKDKMVKNALADYASEQFEIASYHSLIAAATELGDLETANVCQQILQDEEDMAQWLLERIPQITHTYLTQLSSTR